MVTKLNVRYAKQIPLLRYIVPFSYGDKSFDEASADILRSGRWKKAMRSDLVPSCEEDLYEHIYTSILDAENASNNLGTAFLPAVPQQRHMVYRFSRDGVSANEFHFCLADSGLFIFRTGVGFYVYDAVFSDDFPDNETLSADELVLFQNRIKELNILRGFQSKGTNYFCIYPYDAGSPAEDGKIPYYTLAQEIAGMLQDLFGKVFYYPPRVNERLKMEKITEIREQWEGARRRFEEKNVHPNQKKYKRRKQEFDLAKEKWANMTVSDIVRQEGLPSDVKVVPDKALLFSYVVFNTDRELASEEEKAGAIHELCRNAYYLTRGYKQSYKVASDAANERAQMFERHENDFWDAALEGAGDYVLLYDHLLDREQRQNYSHFFDTIRPREMKGDYFLLYILLLYQHYSIVLYSRKISETVPGQRDALERITDDEDRVYAGLRTLKNELDLFMANSMFEAIGQITDVCNLYTYIETKLQIKKNLETLRQGLDGINHLCEDIIRKKERETEEKINSLVTVFGFLVIISIVVDAMSLVLWFKNDMVGVLLGLLHIPAASPVLDLIFLIISAVILILLVVTGIRALTLFRKYKK